MTSFCNSLIPGLVWPPFITSREPDRTHRLQGFQSCCSPMRCVGYACNTVVTVLLTSCHRYAFNISSYTACQFRGNAPLLSEVLSNNGPLRLSCHNMLFYINLMFSITPVHRYIHTSICTHVHTFTSI
jgi:hypothetical protein